MNMMPEIERAAKVLKKAAEDVQLHDILLIRERMTVTSAIATLVENEYGASARFLADFYDLDVNAPVDIYALSQLTDRESARTIGLWIEQYDPDDFQELQELQEEDDEDDLEMYNWEEIEE